MNELRDDPVFILRRLMREHNLTQKEVAALAGVSIKGVEGYLAAPDAVSHRRLHMRHVRSVQAALPEFLAARNGQKAAP